ncbi:hypothetical protein BDN72DRAFT_403578 [Pluteus cervinus]|uniref:Uncharacterized protein n=1 Tax=Pluteus cervinus TaxID=181527 RepID=A0ACD3A9Y0_9AGAR|nr:hypothetical protein BDN72DRAFT_403578 [Pluteus cervinus]
MPVRGKNKSTHGSTTAPHLDACTTNILRRKRVLADFASRNDPIHTYCTMEDQTVSTASSDAFDRREMEFRAALRSGRYTPFTGTTHSPNPQSQSQLKSQTPLSPRKVVHQSNGTRQTVFSPGGCNWIDHDAKCRIFPYPELSEEEVRAGCNCGRFGEN